MVCCAVAHHVLLTTGAAHTQLSLEPPLLHTGIGSSSDHHRAPPITSKAWEAQHVDDFSTSTVFSMATSVLSGALKRNAFGDIKMLLKLYHFIPH